MGSLDNFLRIGNRLVNIKKVSHIELSVDGQQPSTRVFFQQVPRDSSPYIDFEGEDYQAWQHYADTLPTFYPDRAETVNYITTRSARSARFIAPFQTLIEALLQHPENFHEFAASFAPPPSGYKRALAEVHNWIFSELRSRFNKDLPEFLLLLGRMNRRFKIVSNPIKGLRPLFPGNQAVMDAYRSVCLYHGTQLKPITVQDYFDCGIISGELAQEKLLAVFNAAPQSAQILALKQVGSQFRQEAIAHKQTIHPERKKPSRRKQK
jgi:hypothetical protein